MEDVIAKLAQAHYSVNHKDRKFMRSLSGRVERGEELTTRQGFALIRMLSEQNNLCYEIGLKPDEYRTFLQNPKWRNPLKPSVWLKNEVRFMGDAVLAFRCTPSKEMDATLALMGAVYYGGVRLVRLNGLRRLNEIIEFLGRWGFALDEGTEEYLAGAMRHTGDPTKATTHDNRILIDVCDDSVMAEFVRSVLSGQSL